MLQTTFSRLARGATAALFLLVLAGPALANDDDWGDDGDRRAYPVYRHGDNCDRDSYRDYDRGYWGRDQRGGQWGRGGYGDSYSDRNRWGGGSYHDCSCGRRWRDRDRFHQHMRRHHHGFRG